ncbi:MAG: hypothetical protein ACRELA_22060, partial [Candidatus Rokuibacteriota bacterium]
MAWYNDNGELVAGRKPGSRGKNPCGSEQRTCTTCGGSFRVERNQLRRYIGAGTYCSRTCKHRAQRGVELVVGTRYVRVDGYVAVKVGIRKYELEHRVVMERELGRELTAD